MGRDKLKRNLQFKPRCKTFGARSCESEDIIHLLHEELEALYLMDSQELYQADAASEMNVSRPTFARILKSARQKMTMMLISGATLQIEDEKDEYTVMLASMQEHVLELGKADAAFIYIYHIHQNEILSKEVLENPVCVEDKRPGQVLPLLCNRYKVNFFVATSIGTGLKSALLSRGVYTYSKKTFVEKDLFTMM